MSKIEGINGKLYSNQYHEIRAQNMATIHAELAKLKAIADEVRDEEAQEVKDKKTKATAKRRASSDTYTARVRRMSDQPSRRSTRLSGVRSQTYQDSDSEEEEIKRQKLRKKFPFGAKVNYSGAYSVTTGSTAMLAPINWNELFNDTEEVTSLTYDYDEVYEKELTKMVKKMESKRETLPVSEVTPAMLRTVSESSTDKVYNKELGTSCHQCRQKTLDTKTVCRNLLCIGVRGQLCGFCLNIRYGENAKEALLDPNWSCPCCRGVCNCSICRNKVNMGCTGIMAPDAKERCYKSVMHLLMDTEGVPSDISNFLQFHNVALKYKGRPLKITEKIFLHLCRKSKNGLENLAIHDIPFLNPEDSPFCGAGSSGGSSSGGSCSGSCSESEASDDEEARIDAEIKKCGTKLLSLHCSSYSFIDMEMLRQSVTLPKDMQTEDNFQGFDCSDETLCESGSDFEGFITEEDKENTDNEETCSPSKQAL